MTDKPQAETAAEDQPFHFVPHPDSNIVECDELAFSASRFVGLEEESVFFQLWSRQGGDRQCREFGTLHVRGNSLTRPRSGLTVYVRVSGCPETIQIDGVTKPYGLALCDWLNLYAGYAHERYAKIMADREAEKQRKAAQTEQRRLALLRMVGVSPAE